MIYCSRNGLISDPARRDKVMQVSKCQNVENDPEKIPSRYLDQLSKQFRQDACGEDNVLLLLLSKLLSRVDMHVFLSTRVNFIAMDGKNLDGKPFCEKCDRTVRFFSTLPSFLRHLGEATKRQQSAETVLCSLSSQGLQQ